MGKTDKKVEEKEQDSKFKTFLNDALLICLVLFIFSGSRLIKYNLDKKANDKIIEKISKSITIDESVKDITYEDVRNMQKAKEENADGLQDTEGITIKSKYSIDFETLKEQNSDTVGFLKVKGTDIEFVVVQTVDNNYYLKHNFDKNNNKAGWVFADYRNDIDGTDKNIVIYGHNMLNGTMFSSLSNCLEREWQEEINNRFITFITPDETAIYEVFAVYQIEDDDYYTQTKFTESSFREYIKTALSKSEYDFDTIVNEDDQLLTLVTCGRSNSNRVIVQAKKLKY